MTLAERLRARFEATAGVPQFLVRDHPGSRSATTPAAVLAAVVDRPEPTMLLTRRLDTMRKHAGQVAFPGGRADPDDRDPIDTALREAEEEIGLPPASVTVIGADAPYTTVTGYSVIPVIGVVPPDLPLRPHEHEVADIFEVPLAFLFDPLNRVERSLGFAGAERSYWEYLHGSQRIWGATAAMIVNLARRIGDG